MMGQITRHNSADSVPTSNLVCIKEVAIRITFSHLINIAGIIYICGLVINMQCACYKNAFNKRFFLRIVCQNNFVKIYSEKFLRRVCNAVYSRSCIDLMHNLPPVTAEEYDGSHHPICTEWVTFIIYRL